MARTPFRFITPDTRLRHIQYARDREEERKGRLDEMDARRKMQIDQQMQRETQRSAELDQRDSIQEQTRFEQARSADLDRMEAEQPRGLGMRGRYQEGMPLGPAIPGPTQPTPEQRYDLLTPMTEARAAQAGGGLGGLVERGLGEVGEFIKGEPMLGGPFAEPAGGGPTMATRGLEAVERFRTRVTVPAGASLMQILETRAGATTGGGVAGTPLRTRPISEIAEPGVVVAPKAWFGDEEEQARAQQVMEEAGLIKALVFEFIADPTFLLPGPLGFTKVDDVVRFVKAGAKLTGKARQAWLGSPKVQRLVRAVQAEAGGPRVPGVGPEEARILREIATNEGEGVSQGAKAFWDNGIDTFEAHRTADSASLRLIGLSDDQAERLRVMARNGEIDIIDKPDFPMGGYMSVELKPIGSWAEDEVAQAFKAVADDLAAPAERFTGYPITGVGPEDVARVEPELGGFPERFKGKAGALEGGPPKEPPKAFRLAAGEEPPDWYSTVLRVTERFPESKKLYKGTSLARRAEMTKRTGEYMKLLDGELAKGTPRQEAMENARRAFGGEMPDVEFAEAFMVTPEEVDRLAFRAIDYGKETGHVLEGDRALGAITAMAEKRVPRPHEINAIRRVYGNELADAITKASKDKDWWDTFMELWMFPKAVRSSFDISFPARQGIMVSARHPLMWSNSLKTAARAWVDPKWMMRETRKLLDDPTMIPVKMPDGSVQDMRLGDLFSDTGVIAETVEPFYKSDLAQKLVPGVRRSQVSFTGAGNKLRADMTRHWLNTWKRSGVEITPQRIERLGGLMNALTGRATIPRGWLFEMLQATWWSPQYRLSGPQSFLTATAGWALDPRVAGIATQNLVAFVGGGIGILSMLKASGLADVELDPRSSDFGKIRLGPTRINFWGSSQLLIRTIAQSITTTRIDPQLGPQTIDPGQPWARYWQSGASPQFSLITDYATGETYLGETLRPSEERGITMGEVAQREFGTGGQRWMPLAWLDIKEAIEEDAVRGGLIGSLGMTGMGVQSYEPRAAQELQTIPEFKHLDVMQIQELKDFWAEVGDFRKRLEEEEGMVVPPELAIRVWGETQGQSPAFIELAVDLRQGTSTRREARNPDYVRFIAEHADEIREDKPDLITQEIRLILHEMEKVQQAVAQ